MANPCTVAGCPDPRNEAEWHLRPCLHIGGVEHAEGGHHHHWPKQSQGGTEIVGFPCAFCHDRIDNGNWGNKVEPFPDGTRHWLVWDLHGECLIDRVIGESPSVDGGVATAMEVAGIGPPTVTVATDTKVIGEADGEAEDTQIPASAGHTASTLERGLSPMRAEEKPLDPLIELTPTGLQADWSGLTDDELSTEFQQGDTLQQAGFLRKCKAVNAYRSRVPHGVNWVESAYNLFHQSRRTLEAYSNIYELYVTSDASIADNIGPLTDSKALMMHIGRKSIEDGRAALEEAVAYLAQYGEAPTVAALTHKLKTEEPNVEPICNHHWKCTECGARR